LKQQKPWFDEEWLRIFDQRKQAIMQWLQDPNHSNVGNLNYVRREAIRHFRNKKKEYLKLKLTNLKLRVKLKNVRDLYRGNNDFKKGYQPGNNIAKDEKGDLLKASHSILVRWRNHFSQLLNVSVT
jgi:hypothetical protein